MSAKAVKSIEDLVERLASIEHERWAHWQSYLHDRCESLPDGSLVIPADLAERWRQQIDTRYEELSETEKESDREQVRKYLPLVNDFFGDTGSRD